MGKGASLRRLMSLLVVCAMSMGVVSTAFAGAAEQYKKQAAQFEKMLDKEAKSAGADAAKEDIEQTRTWLENAKVLLAKGNEDAAARLLRRVKISLDLVDALVQAGSIQKAADDQEEAYFKAQKKQLPELKAEVQKLKEKKKKLEQEMSTLR